MVFWLETNGLHAFKQGFKGIDQENRQGKFSVKNQNNLFSPPFSCRSENRWNVFKGRPIRRQPSLLQRSYCWREKITAKKALRVSW